MQVLSILFGASFTAAVCVALGLSILRWARAPLKREEQLPLALVTGAPVLSMSVFALGMLKLVYWELFLAAGIAILVAAASRGAFNLSARRFPALPRFHRWLFASVFSAFGVVYLCYAMAPEMSPDGSAYHLGLVAKYLRAHGFERITTHLYANLSQGIEMLFLFAFALGRHSAAALVHLVFLVAATFSMLSYSRRFGFAEAGVAGALLFLVSPVVGMDGSIAYNDVATTAVLFTLFYLLRIWSEEPSDRLLVPIGLLAGFCYGVKYTAALGLVFATGFVLWRLRNARRPVLRPMLIFGLCAFLMVAPWMARNLVWLDNPVSPFFNKLFPNPYTHLSFEQAYSHQMRNYPGLESHWDIPLEVTVRGFVLCGLLGPIFLLAPLGLGALRWKEGRWLWLLALVCGLPYAANIGTRFLIFPLPYVALAMAMVFTRVPKLAPAIVVAHAVLSWPSVVPTYAHPYSWRIDGIRWKAALRIESEESFLTRRFPSYSVARLLEEQVPEGEKILTFRQVAESYTSRETLVAYQGAWNEVLGDMLWTPQNPAAHPTRMIRFDFPARPYRKLRVVQTASNSPEHWSITELRVFRDGEELPRAERWRLRAQPNPWDVQRAFDNSPATRWRSWQPISDGMFVELDFGTEEQVDAIVIQATADQWNIRLRLEGARKGSDWETISEEFTESNLSSPPAGLRRMVAEELKRAGVRYILVSETDFGKEDYGRRPRAWNLTLLGEAAGARLYRFE